MNMNIQILRGKEKKTVCPNIVFTVKEKTTIHVISQFLKAAFQKLLCRRGLYTWRAEQSPEPVLLLSTFQHARVRNKFTLAYT